MDVMQLRAEIPVLSRMTYMNTGWSGPPPRSVAEALKTRVDLEMEEGAASPAVQETGREIRSNARLAAAGLLNASIDEVLVTRNTTEGLNIVLSGLDWKPRGRNHHLQPGTWIGRCSDSHAGGALRGKASGGDAGSP